MEKYGSIDQFTEEELTAQLEKLNREKVPTDRPAVLADANFDNLIKEAEKIIDSIMDGSFHADNDHEYYMYESAMEAVYGPGIWKWYNKYV